MMGLHTGERLSDVLSDWVRDNEPSHSEFLEQLGEAVSELTMSISVSDAFKAGNEKSENEDK